MDLDDENGRRHYADRLGDMEYHIWRTVLARQSFINEQPPDEDGFHDVINMIVNDAGFSELLYDRDREAAELVFDAAAAIVTREVQKNRAYGGSAGQEDYVAWRIDQLLHRHWTPEERKQHEREAMQAQADEMRAQEKAKRDQEEAEQIDQPTKQSKQDDSDPTAPPKNRWGG